MLPKLAIVGRPNVGKSALFNRICQKRISIVDEAEGITRDRLYAEVELFGRPFLLIDTGGIDFAGKIPFAEEVKRQAEFAIEEADAILFVVDGKVGVTIEDELIARVLRKTNKPILLAVNKLDREEEIPTPFASLGIGQMMGISAMHGHWVAEILEQALAQIEEKKIAPSEEGEAPPIRVAILGRTNVGKSTLLNCLLDDERSIASPIAGTTRDAIDVTLEKDGQRYLLIDTAGIRRKKSEKEVVDKFAAIRTQEALERADVALLVCDAFDGFTTQEMRIAAEIERQGKSCILLFNKWDLIDGIQMEHALRGVREAAPFLTHCPALCLSALQGRNINRIFPAIQEVYKHRFLRLPTASLNQLIELCQKKYQPPMITGKRLRIYYLTQVTVNPPRFVLFVNRPDLMTESYRKFLINQLRKAYPFTGSPLIFELKGKKKRNAIDP
ncbi:MAG: ribosome biogenesis GTPase Der [Chlamydiia bacterium]|nr:ribosome biogenesis GTPase Der [Chlamydiia bacterium]